MAPRPKDFSLTYEYIHGTVPPPHYYEFTIALKPDGSGLYSFRPGYPGMDSGLSLWKERFKLAGRQLDALWADLNRLGIASSWKESSEPRVGGPRRRLKVIASGRELEVPSQPSGPGAEARAEKLWQRVEATVPESLRKKMTARFEALGREARPRIQ